MLLAEVHGHRVPEAQSSEDYLTSAVFGHLRYLPPNVFWPDLFKLALGMPNLSASTLSDKLAQSGFNISTFDTLEIHFWPSHPIFGSPDLILVFSGRERRPVVILIEAKLWAEKSGTGDFDQIARYLRLLDQPDGSHPVLPAVFTSALIYLTEHHSLAELEESALACEIPSKARERFFRLQWQDVVLAASRVLPVATGTATLILRDVISFLSQRRLEYFSGFHHSSSLKVSPQRFKMFGQELFTRLPLPLEFQSKRLPVAQPSGILSRTPLPSEFVIRRGPWL